MRGLLIDPYAGRQAVHESPGLEPNRRDGDTSFGALIEDPSVTVDLTKIDPLPSPEGADIQRQRTGLHVEVTLGFLGKIKGAYLSESPADAPMGIASCMVMLAVPGCLLAALFGALGWLLSVSGVWVLVAAVAGYAVITISGVVLTSRSIVPARPVAGIPPASRGRQT